MKKIGILIRVFTLLGFFGTVSARGESNVRVLIVDGFSNHDWKHTTRCIQAILEQSAEVDIAFQPSPKVAVRMQ